MSASSKILQKALGNKYCEYKMYKQPGFSVDFLSDGPELLIGGETSARRADTRPVGPSY